MHIALDGQQFIARLLQHVLPPGFKRIRHHGLPAPAAKTERLAVPAANPQARKDAQAFMRRVAASEIDCCPHCKVGRWRVLGKFPADRSPLAAASATFCRGPP